MYRKSVLVAALISAWALPAVAQQGPGVQTVVVESNENLATLILRVFGPEGLFVDSKAVLPSGETHSAHFNSAFQSEFTRINLALSTQLLSIPLPSPASGFTYSLDPDLGVPIRSTQSWGPILADRAETIGAHRYSFGFAYQHFGFGSIDGLDLETLPAVFTHDGAAPGGRADVVSTLNAIDASTDRFTTFFTYGLHDRVDLSVALPIVHTMLSVSSFAVVERIGTGSNPAVHFFDDEEGSFGDARIFSATDSASGIGDMIVRGKARFAEFGCAAAPTAADNGCTRLAAGANFRIPTGNEMDLLGVGGAGVAPFFIASTHLGKVTPHFNFSYEWNGDSVLAGDPVNNVKGDLPDQLIYAVGADIGVTEGLTVAVDLLGRTIFDASRLEIGTFHALDGTSTFPNVEFRQDSLNVADLAAGVKFNAYRDLLIDFNVVFKLNDDGIRARISPLVGIEYAF